MSVSWFDGTTGTTAEKIKAQYPIAITEELRASEDESKIALINRFPKETPLNALADPHMELNYRQQSPFYHVFFNDDAEKAREFIARFVAAGHGTNDYEVHLYREDPEEVYEYGLFEKLRTIIFEYSYGEICTDMLRDPDALTALLPAELQGGRAFVLPLKVYRFACPVCGTRSLQYRGMCDICDECGWEDDGTDDEDEVPFISPNGFLSIRKYRKKYLKLKNKDPNYSWYKQFEH